MKKITFLMTFVALLIFSAQAQNHELLSKKGFKILPESGDIAIGVDFAPFVNSLNFMGGTSTGPAVTLADGASIFGKYYKDEKHALRMKFAFNMNSLTLKNNVLDQSSPTNSLPDDVVLDKVKLSYAQFYLSLGMETRRGHGRVQGYYGTDLFIVINNGTSNTPNETYTYGNDFSSTNTNPITTTDFLTSSSSPVFARKTEFNKGFDFGIGARGFVGVEYFFAPKISIGGELGWGISYVFASESEQIIEGWDNVSGSVKTETYKIAGANQFILGSDGATNSFSKLIGLSGNINLIFHF